MPERITLSRAKGFRMPPNTVKVDRSTKWGNPFQIGKMYCTGRGDTYREEPITAMSAVAHFREMLGQHPRNYPTSLLPLRGKNLACWCKPGEPCHADVLLEIANNPEGARKALSETGGASDPGAAG